MREIVTFSDAAARRCWIERFSPFRLCDPPFWNAKGSIESGLNEPLSTSQRTCCPPLLSLPNNDSTAFFHGHQSPLLSRPSSVLYLLVIQKAPPITLPGLQIPHHVLQLILHHLTNPSSQILRPQAPPHPHPQTHTHTQPDQLASLASMCQIRRYRYDCGDHYVERHECNTYLIKRLCPDPEPTVTVPISGPCTSCRLKGWSSTMKGWFGGKKG